MKTILVVDDETDIRDALVEILTREDYIVQAARNGQDALDLLNSTEVLPQLIILDGQMPVMDGKTFFRLMSKDPRTSKIPVLVISGSELPIPELPDYCKFFRKPFPVRRLLTEVSELINLNPEASIKAA